MVEIYKLLDPIKFYFLNIYIGLKKIQFILELHLTKVFLAMLENFKNPSLLICLLLILI